jgi:small subunit ribosomal protein S9
MTAEKKTPAKKPAAHKATAHAGKPATPRKPKAATKKVEQPEAALPEVETQPEVQPKALVIKQVGTEKFYAVGKRKTAVAQVQVTGGDGKITVNELAIEKYFGTPDLQGIVMQPLNSIGMEKSVSVRGKVHGGGIHAQAEAMRHAITRSLVSIDPESRRTLKKLGFLTRDPRVKERKKPGLKRARRAPQFSKR